MIANFASYEAYRLVLMGDDMAHLTQLVSDAEPLHADCLACERIRRALALVEFHEIPEVRR